MFDLLPKTRRPNVIRRDALSVGLAFHDKGKPFEKTGRKATGP